MDTKRNKIRFIKDNIFNIILIIVSGIMIFLALAISNGLQKYKRDVYIEQEEYARTYVRNDLNNVKDDLEFFLFNNDQQVSNQVIETWAKSTGSTLQFSEGVTHSYILSTSNCDVLYDNTKRVNKKIDVNKLIFYPKDNRNIEYTLDQVIRSYNDTGQYSQWCAKDENGDEYLAEWIYSPTDYRGYNGQKYVINAEVNPEANGVVILALKDQSFFKYKISTTINYINNTQSLLFYFTGVCIIIISVSLIYILYMERKVDYLEDLLKLNKEKIE